MSTVTEQVAAEARQRCSMLTPRELTSLQLIAKGYSRREAGALQDGIKASTVRFHLENAMNKMGCEKVIVAAVMAAKAGLA
jgi:DNA-binding CsgD family transcriptional regulator